MVYISRDKDPIIVPRDQVKVGQCFASIVEGKPTTRRFAHLGQYRNVLQSVNLETLDAAYTPLPVSRTVALVGKYVFRGVLLDKELIKAVKVSELAPGDLFAPVIKLGEKPKPFALLRTLPPGVMSATHALDCFNFDQEQPRLDRITVGATVHKVGTFTIEVEVI